MSENNEAATVTVNALVAKRADILFEIGEHEGHAERLRTQVVHLDAVIRLFKPDFDAESAPIRLRRPAKSPYFKHGEMTQRITTRSASAAKLPAWMSPSRPCKTRDLIPTTIRRRAPTSCVA
jgi:hypothetical protein